MWLRTTHTCTTAAAIQSECSCTSAVSRYLAAPASLLGLQGVKSGKSVPARRHCTSTCSQQCTKCLGIFGSQKIARRLQIILLSPKKREGADLLSDRGGPRTPLQRVNIRLCSTEIRQITSLHGQMATDTMPSQSPDAQPWLARTCGAAKALRATAGIAQVRAYMPASLASLQLSRLYPRVLFSFRDQI